MDVLTKSKKTNYKKRKTEEETVLALDGQLPPQVPELEESVLGALMVEKNAFSEIGSQLKPESFYVPKNGKIFAAVSALAMKQEPIDLVTVMEQLKKDGNFEEIGGAPTLSGLTQKVISTVHVYEHAKIIAEKALARQLITFCQGIQKKAYAQEEDVDLLMQEAEGSLFEISKNNLKKDFQHVGEVGSMALETIELAMNSPEGIGGVPSGFTELDKKTNGWQKSDLIIIAARPAMGKTAFVLSMARNIGEAKSPVAVFSLEMSNLQLYNRLLVNVTELSSEKIKKGQLSPSEFKRVQQGVRLIEEQPIYLDDTPSLSVFEFATKARKLCRDHGVEIIIIDYLQLMNASGMGFGSREQEVSTISRSLKQLAKELQIPIIALSQLNRGVESRDKDKRPQLSDLRESGAIEQDADMVLFIHRPEYYKMEYMSDGATKSEGLAEIIIAKHRNGATGDIMLRFIGSQTKFANYNPNEISIGGEMNYADSGQSISMELNPGYTDGTDTAQVTPNDLSTNDTSAPF
ncbi:MAG: replicative DNA helicase [Paludibacteraceae bacterium]|nr:replicative DNA helicase [Paludibacteraceae bacterium]